MDPRLGACVVSFLLAGCAAGEPGPAQTPQEDGPGPAAQVAAATTMRFGSGDREGNLSFEATFSSLDACFVTCTGTAVQEFDLTPIVPAAAPVELAVVVSGVDAGMAASLVLDEASAARQATTHQGDLIQLAATLVRDADGAVAIELMHILPLSPSPEPVQVTIDARSVVRADQLPPRVPADVRLQGGDSLSFTGPNVTQALLLGPNGYALRSHPDALNLTLPDTAPSGTYTLVVEGGNAVVSGPNTTLSARRTQAVYGEFAPVAMGGDTRIELPLAVTPLRVGIVLRSDEDSASPMPWMGEHTASMTAPDGARVAEGENPCGTPMCQGGGFTFQYDSPFMHGSLTPGTYVATVSMEAGDSVEAAGLYVTVV